MISDDDEALSWAGDDSDPTASSAPVTSRRSRSARETGKDDEGESTDTGDGVETVRQTGPVALVVMSLLGGLLVLSSIGWALSIGPLQAAFRPIDLLGTTMFSLGLVFAVASPFVWLGASIWLTRSRPAWHRVAALAIGTVLLVPWPYLVGLR
ncbi:hypothetical protein ELQ90_08060 [Labedella phragmitis]|uniref:DNA polymerase III subunit gamma/tau n=1 Tax=Labedella phragmitis TaxID=2498849 RepID=A0A3S4AMT3_9MICO|nr:hypothetical protein [Labedella phragmitis]RWZ52011.1 hypothetical protein ELQ90_08060 [Labedella phragmitis]